MLVNATGSNQPLVQADRKTDIRIAPLRRLTIRDLLRDETPTSNLEEYTRELVFSNNACPQYAAGATENALNNESRHLRADSKPRYHASALNASIKTDLGRLAKIPVLRW